MQDDPDSHERRDIIGVGEHPVIKGILPVRSPSQSERTTRFRNESKAAVPPFKRECAMKSDASRASCEAFSA